jgi:uncharacterized protein YaeQ
MSGKYSFTLASEDRKRDLPRKLIIGQQDTETIVHVALKLMGFLLFYRERLLVEPTHIDDQIPFVPDLAQLDYQLRPVLWVECGECGVAKLNKLAVKVPEAEIWILKKSPEAAEDLFRQMAKGELRRDRYNLVGLDPEMFEEICSLSKSRNQVFWLSGDFDPPNLQFEFNGLWFDAPFTITRF